MPQEHEGDGDSEMKMKESGQVPLVPTPAPFLNGTTP